MALVTLCPDCGTTYRVRAEQLQAHGGKVCCGQCQSVFNGFSTLITVDESEITVPHQSVDKSSAANNLSVDDNSNDSFASSFSSDWEEEGIESENGFLNQSDRKLSQKSFRMWALASLFMMILLLGQVTYIFRLELTEIAPGTRPYLEKYCAIFSCAVPFPQQINLLSIETSDLQVNPKDESEVLTLTATIRNHAAYPLALPQLKFSLTDIHDQLLASRMLTMQDYLQENTDSIVSIQPNHEINIKVHFDGNNLNSAGYRLLLMY
jgi:predicted Zn finger-like uncharacterized protein